VATTRLDLSTIQAAYPIECARITDLAISARINRSIERVIRSHARLVGDEWAILMHVEAMNGDFAAIVERSRDLVWLNGQLRRDAADMPEIGGTSDDASLITTALASGAALCAPCIAQKTGVPGVEVPSVIAKLGTALRVERPDVPCDVCRTTRKVYRLTSPAQAIYGSSWWRSGTRACA